MALNAVIWVSRVGVQGRGVAVVADEECAKEVAEGEQLAEGAGQALNQILESVWADSQQIIQISAVTQQLSASSTEMVTSIDTVSTVVEENSVAAQQMTANNDQVTQSAENIAAITTQNSAAIQEMSASAEEVTAPVQQFVASTQSMDKMVQELRDAVATFSGNGKVAA